MDVAAALVVFSLLLGALVLWLLLGRATPGEKKPEVEADGLPGQGDGEGRGAGFVRATPPSRPAVRGSSQGPKRPSEGRWNSLSGVPCRSQGCARGFFFCRLLPPHFSSLPASRRRREGCGGQN